MKLYKPMSHGGFRPGAGRKKGGKNTATLEADAFHEALLRRISEHQEDLVRALVSKALEGDMAAMKEINNRVLGKPTEFIDAKIEEERITGFNFVSNLSNEELGKIIKS